MTEPTWKAAEKALGRRVQDRRLSYTVLDDGAVIVNVTISSACSGCSETWEGHAPEECGSGCDSCGYTGRSRSTWGIPIEHYELSDDERRQRREMRRTAARIRERRRQRHA